MKRNFKQLRVDAKLRQIDIGNRVGVTVQSVNRWERGRSPIARKYWIELANMFNVSLNELESALVQTLLDACMERGNTDALKNAVVSGLYRPELLQEAFARFKTYPAPTQPTSNEQTTELREQILKLREENLKLRETIIELRERCATPYQVHASTPSQFTSNFESEVKK